MSDISADTQPVALPPEVLDALNGVAPPAFGDGNPLPPEVLDALNAQAGPPPPPAPTPEQRRSMAQYGPQSTLGDINKSALDAPVKALIGMIGLPATLVALERHANEMAGGGTATTFTKDAAGNLTNPVTAPAQGGMPSLLGALPTAAAVRSAVEAISGGAPLYEPQGPAGRYTDRAISGGILAGIPGLAGGIAGQAARDLTGSEAADVIASIAGAGLTSLARSLTSAPAGQISRALAGVTDAQLAQAEQLMRNAEAQGTPLTAAEAIASVTGGNNRLTTMQRVLEASPAGAERIEPMMTARPAANAAAAGNVLDQISPAPAQPFEVAPRVQEAAQGALDETRQAINAVTKPLYDASANNPGATLSAAAFRPLANDAQIAGAIKAVRADPIHYGDLSRAADNSLPVLDAAKKWIDDQIAAASRNGANAAVANLTAAQGKLLGAIDTQSSIYGLARRTQETLRGAFLDPMERAPIGQLAAAEKFPDQVNVLFPQGGARELLPGMERQVGDAVRTVASADPDAARQMVRMYLEQEFNQTTRDLATGPNQFGGAAFRARVVGNDQQAANLRAAVDALPGGTDARKALDNLLDIFKAQGMRARAGSATAFNAEMQAELAKGGTVGEIFRQAGQPGSFLKSVATSAYYNRNASRLADILTSPDAIAQMRAIARIEPGSNAAKALYAMLVAGTAEQPESQQ